MSEESVLTSPRAIRQYLESLERAGVTHVPATADAVCSPVIVNEQTPVAVLAPRGGNVTANASSVVPHVPQQSAVQTQSSARGTSEDNVTDTVESRSSTSDIKPGTIPDQEAPVATRSSKTRAKREQSLCLLAEQVAACVRCTELAQSRRQTVFGIGNPEASIMFVGEAPGADEDKQGEPFVGRAGKLLNDIIAACRLTREEIYICNILRCRPPGNRNPTPTEAGNCREYLDGQIAIVDPDYIVCWGSVAAQNLLGVTTPIGRMRGQFFEHGRAKVCCTYHPSYLLRNPSAKKHVWEDMKLLMRDMGVTL